MRLLLLLCALTNVAYSEVNLLLSTIYDVYDFDQKEVHLDKCDDGCIIYAATMGETFDQYPNKVDPYATNLFIYDNNKGSNVMSIVELSAKVDPSTKVKQRLDIQGPANISVINKNPTGAEKFTVVLYVVSLAHGGSLPHAVYDIADIAGSTLATNTRNVTFISARPYKLEAERSDQQNNITVVLAGFDSWWNSDFCPVAFETKNSTVSNPFPGFVIQPNTPLVSLFMGMLTPIVLHPTYNFEHNLSLAEDSFITSPGWNGCTKPGRGGIQTFRSPFDKPTDSFLLSSDEFRNVRLTVIPNLDEEHALKVKAVNEESWLPTAVYYGEKEKTNTFTNLKGLNISYSDLSGSQGFIALYYSEKPYVWTAPESYCNCAMRNGLPVDWKTTDINLDIVLIIDISAAMASRLDEAKSMITSFISGLNTDPRADFYTKIGVIAAADSVDVVYNMTMKPGDNLDSVMSKNVDTMDFEASLREAIKIIGEAENYNPRPARQIVYYLTASEAPASVKLANLFKGIAMGVIVVNEFLPAGASPTPSLVYLASENYYFTDLTDDYTSNWGVLCEASCFCGLSIHGFNDDSKSVRTGANRGCYKAFNEQRSQSVAANECRRHGVNQAGTLVSIHDQEKENFVLGVVSEFGPKTKYWIGLENNKTAWNWFDESTDLFTDWDTNQPNTQGDQNQCAYAVQTTGLNVRWTAADCDMDGVVYVCETAPCSVGNVYC